MKKVTKALKTKYISKIDILYEVILSKGKGKMTNKLNEIVLQLINNYMHGYYQLSYEDQQDYRSDAYIRIYETFMGFDETKYDNALAYFTQIIKMSFYKTYNKLHKNNENNLKINDIYTL